MELHGWDSRTIPVRCEHCRERGGPTPNTLWLAEPAGEHDFIFRTVERQGRKQARIEAASAWASNWALTAESSGSAPDEARRARAYSAQLQSDAPDEALAYVERLIATPLDRLPREARHARWVPGVVAQRKREITPRTKGKVFPAKCPRCGGPPPVSYKRLVARVREAIAVGADAAYL